MTAPVKVEFWKNKQNGRVFRVVPWWEIPEPIVADDKAGGAIDVGTHLTEGRKFKIGTLVQVGWLMENENGVWFGLGLRAKKHFRKVKPPKTWQPKARAK